jgi:transposase
VVDHAHFLLVTEQLGVLVNVCRDRGGGCGAGTGFTK